jgi:hypothetical protein
VKALDGHAVGREQIKENLVDGALAALRLPSRSAPCIICILVKHVVKTRMSIAARHNFLELRSLQVQ